MSIVKDLSLTTLNTIAKSLDMVEDNGLPANLKSLKSPMSPEPVGGARVFNNDAGYKMVYIALSVPMIQLDSHMVFCFTGPENPLPHFTLDAVHAGEHYAFHLDLIPRMDLACNYAYTKEIYDPLNKVFQEGKQIEGLSEAVLSPTQISVMSPWMLAYRATLPAMDQVGITTGKYLDHWLQLEKSGISADHDILGTNMSKRDAIHRLTLFSPEVDPVWERVEKMIGKESNEGLRALLLA